MAIVPHMGRQVLFAELREACRKHRIVGVTGMTSVGKSFTVQQFLEEWDMENDASKGSSITIDLEDIRDWSEFTRMMSHRAWWVSTADDSDSDDDDEEQAWYLNFAVNVCQANIRFIFFDNAQNILLIAQDKFDEMCLSVLKGSPDCRLIYTSDYSASLDKVQEEHHQLELQPLTEEESACLLAQAAPSVPFDRHLRRIADKCGGLPLALLFTACELETSPAGITTEDLDVIFSEMGIKTFCQESYADRERVDLVLLRPIARLPEIFRDRLLILGFIPGSFCIQHVQDMLGDDSSTTTCDVLRRSHILFIDTHTGRFIIHRLTRDCITTFFTVHNTKEIRERFCRTFASTMHKLGIQYESTDVEQAFAELRHELPNLMKLFGQITVMYTEIPDNLKQIYPFLVTLTADAYLLIQRVLQGRCLQFYEICLELSRSWGQRNDEAVFLMVKGKALSNLLGRPRSGERFYRQCLKVLEDCPLNKMHVIVYQRMGWNLYMQGKFRRAIKYLMVADKLERELDMDDVTVLRTLNALAVTHTSLGNMEEAEHYHMLSMDRRKAKLGELHPFYGASLHNYGKFCFMKGLFAEAWHNYTASYDLKLKKRHIIRSIIDTQNSMARFLVHQGHHQQALDILDDAWLRLERSHRLYGYEQGLLLNSYGCAYVQHQNYEKAVVSLHQAIAHLESEYPEHVYQFENFVNLAKAYMHLGRWDGAKEIINRALSIQKLLKYNKPYSLLLLDCLKVLGDIFIKTDESQQAVDDLQGYVEEELKRLIKAYGNYPQIPHFVSTRSELSSQLIYIQQVGLRDHKQDKRTEIHDIHQGGTNVPFAGHPACEYLYFQTGSDSQIGQTNINPRNS
ncbi:uncharacterized protein LOC121370285 [Gigantopelta aegis]|uniref:uncharacterized protein LOC121370285 n=1 Tax=Gigantopelta aegis TaxID=1735272 RepID=UPI001B88B886|nr:uncharacterized protein LOC121370285 [Gigantopelta aegis]